jgi:hypothetical protein
MSADFCEVSVLPRCELAAPLRRLALRDPSVDSLHQ